MTDVRLFQSGEQANVSGVYHLVQGKAPRGTSELTVRMMKRGQTMPFHEGRAACWVLIEEMSDDKVDEFNKPAVAGVS